jgi:putative tricarboxylic transport membrane protein
MTMSQSSATRRVDTAGIVIALALFALSALIWWDLARLELTSTYGVGPKAMPMVVASGLALLGIGNLVIALRGEHAPREPIDLRAIALILGGLVALIAITAVGGGFIPAMAILFATTSAAFGRRAFITDLVIGMVLALVVYLVFSKLLALSLPAGPLERLL